MWCIQDSSVKLLHLNISLHFIKDVFNIFQYSIQDSKTRCCVTYELVSHIPRVSIDTGIHRGKKDGRCRFYHNALRSEIV